MSAPLPPAATKPFVHLHCHTHFSLLDGANRIPELCEHVKKLGMNAVAVTDHGNLYGAIELLREADAAGMTLTIEAPRMRSGGCFLVEHRGLDSPRKSYSRSHPRPPWSAVPDRS